MPHTPPMPSSAPLFGQNGHTFHGVDLTPADENRLNGCAARVFAVAKDGEFRTIAHLREQMAVRFGKIDREESVSRMMRGGVLDGWNGWRKERQSLGAGLWEYRLVQEKLSESP